MSSITAQQAKLDLELVSKEKRLEIRKCNGRLNTGKIQREPTFQVVLDAFAPTPCYSTLITADVPEVYMHQFWDSVYKHDTFYRFKMDKRKRFNSLWKSLEISLRSALECINLGELLLLSLTEVYLERQLVLTSFVSPEHKSFRSKRVKRPTKKSTKAPTGGVLIRETLEMSLSYKTAPSAAKIKPSVTNEGTSVKPGVPDVTKEESTKIEAESWGKDEDDSNNEHDSRSEGNSKRETDENESGYESDQEENEEEIGDDDEEEEDKFLKTSSNDTNNDDETKIKDKAEGDEEMYYTTSQLYDDVDIRLNKPITTDEGFNQKEGADAEMTNIQQGNENPEITLNQVIKDAHVTLSTVPPKTEVPVISSSYSSDLASKFLNFSDIPHTYTEIVSPMDVHVHHEVPSKQTPTLLTVPISVITESSPIYSTVIPQSIPSFTLPPP
ncbi:hypothetical protein Tco_0959632 [Tanacetum coccineum]